MFNLIIIFLVILLLFLEKTGNVVYIKKRPITLYLIFCLLILNNINSLFFIYELFIYFNFSLGFTGILGIFFIIIQLLFYIFLLILNNKKMFNFIFISLFIISGFLGLIGIFGEANIFLFGSIISLNIFSFYGISSLILLNFFIFVSSLKIYYNQLKS